MIKTKFYFYDNNQIKSKEDYLICKLKSGKSHINIETDDDTLNNRITNP